MRLGSFLFLVLLVAAIVWPAPVSGQEESVSTATAAAFKVGVVDRKKAFDGYGRAQAALKELETERNTLQEKLDSLSASVLEKKNEYDASKATLTEEERDALEEEVQSRYQTYRTEHVRLQEEVDRKHAKIIKKCNDEIDAAIVAIGGEENYHLILEGDRNVGRSVLYFSTTIEITSKVIERVNSTP